MVLPGWMSWMRFLISFVIDSLVKATYSGGERRAAARLYGIEE